MIKIENTDVLGWEAAVRGMRNPMNSWQKSDSLFRETDCFDPDDYPCGFKLGENDLKLMRNLVKAGSDHSKFMRYINVTCDILAPLYWWKEYDTYKVGTVANSCSTMHKIHAKPFVDEDFSVERCVGDLIVLRCIDTTIYTLNHLRDKFIETGDKAYWDSMIQLLPTSYNQRRTVQLNYAVLRNMHKARKNHKLDEWRSFCEWAETLPYAKELIVSDNE